MIRVVLTMAVLLLSGCAATVHREALNNRPLAIPQESSRKIVLNVTGSQTATNSDDWEQLKGEWRAAMKSATREAGVAFGVQEGAPNLMADAGTLIVVHVNDYRYISPGARYGFGVFTGNAFVDSNVEFRDLMSGRRYGARSYNTSSSAWEGVFSAMTGKQIQAICNEMVTEINPGYRYSAHARR